MGFGGGTYSAGAGAGVEILKEEPKAGLTKAEPNPKGGDELRNEGGSDDNIPARAFEPNGFPSPKALDNELAEFACGEVFVSRSTILRAVGLSPGEGVPIKSRSEFRLG